MDESAHWHACADCEEQLEKAEHDMVWTETTPAAVGTPGEETGVCSVCGYSATRRIEPLEPETDSAAKDGAQIDTTFGMSEETFRYVVLGILGSMVVGLVALLITAAVKRGKRGRGRR